MARVISKIEREEQNLPALIAKLLPFTGDAMTVGFTGPPGLGKSSIIAGLIRLYREEGKKVGVVSVDPSSSFTKGAILGDCIRLSDHFLDKVCSSARWAAAETWGVWRVLLGWRAWRSRPLLHVQSGLAMAAIHDLGNEEQKQRWLPDMAKCEKIGCFGLTGPEVGGDPGFLKTTAVERDGDYLLNGEKKWIGNASSVDVAVIRACTEDGTISCFLIAGTTLDLTPRSSPQGLPARRLADAHHDEGLPRPGGCAAPESERSRLDPLHPHGLALRCRLGWPRTSDGLLRDGASVRQSEDAVRGAIASCQLVQQKLVQMVNEISLGQLLSIHMGRTKDTGNLDTATVSMFKMNNVAKSRRIAALARDVLGGQRRPAQL